MDKRFERRLELAMNPRARKRNGKVPMKFSRSSSHTAAVVDDILEEMTSGGGHFLHPNPYVMTRSGTDAAMAPVVAAHHLAVAAIMDGVEAVKDQLGKKERMLKTEKRRKYYAADAERRKQLRERIRAARPPVTCACPSPQQLSEAYARRGESEEWQ